MKTRCSWCLAETNTPPNPGDSHTICERHRAQVLAEYGIKDAVDVARTYKELRVERNDDLDGLPHRLEREEIGWRTFWTCIGIGITAAAAALGLVLVMTL